MRSEAPSIGLHVNIGRITLEGYTPADRRRFAYALQSSLTGLARTPNSSRWPAVPALRMNHLDAGQLPPGASPEEAARHVARQIFATLTRQPGGKQHA